MTHSRLAAQGDKPERLVGLPEVADCRRSNSANSSAAPGLSSAVQGIEDSAPAGHACAERNSATAIAEMERKIYEQELEILLLKDQLRSAMSIAFGIPYEKTKELMNFVDLHGLGRTSR